MGSVMHGILEGLANGFDHYLNCFDFVHYIEAQERVDAAYKDYRKWTEMAILGVAKSGKFSSDRTIAEYCSQIWDIEAVPVPQPSTNPNQRTRSFTNLTDMQ